MKEILQKIDTKKIRYIIAILAVASIFAAGVRGIIEVHNTGVQTYNVQDQHVGPVEAEGVFTHEFLCVGKETIALQIDGAIDNQTSGTVKYEIKDSPKYFLK